ncbi:potassium channel family protein [Rhodococcus sp. 1168]|uniref:potassium channel family protein n=1 Tax=Rhodococcus sp. 1168 TaxID=2018041 RepID=UPI000A0E9E1C|nr:potassium channel family protein [Rhodococcus sp. 1168]ORI23219.1 ion channel family protein [Rhodococcus sp. 1168]
MAGSTRYSKLSDKERRVLLFRALFRPVVTAALLTAFYFAAPMDDVADVGSITILAAVLIGVGIVSVWQVTKVLKADYPTIQAIEATAAIVPVYLIGFSTVYYMMSEASYENFTEPVSRMGSLYFTLSVFSTVGFGDIAASTDPARAVVSLQIIGNLVLIALGGRLLLAAIRRGQARNAD